MVTHAPEPEAARLVTAPTGAPRERPDTGHVALALWGISGVALLLGQAVYRLAPLAREALMEHALTPLHLTVGVLWLAFSLYSEGYRAFHLRYCPRVVARAMHLAREPHALRGALAPLFCMGLFHAPLRSKVVSWVMVAFIVGIVALVRQIPQPWRGLIDLGVVAALGMGLVSLAYYTVRALRGHAPNVDPRLPQTPPAP